MAVRTPGAGLPARPRLLGPVLVVAAPSCSCSAASSVSLLHRPAVVPQRRLHAGLHHRPDDPAAAVRRLRAAHGGHRRRQRRHRLPGAPAVPADVAGAAEPRALPRRRRAVPAQHPAGRQRRVRPVRRAVGRRALGDLAAVAQRHARSASRTRSSAATSPTSPSPTRSSASSWASCSPRVVLSLHRRGGRALPVRRRAPADGGGEGQPRRARPPVGARRPDRAAQGVRLLPRPLRPGVLRAGLRQRARLHRRQRGAAGQEHPHRHRAHLRACCSSPTSSCATSCCRPARSALLVVSAVVHRRHLPGLHPAVPGQARTRSSASSRSSSATSRRPGRRTASTTSR